MLKIWVVANGGKCGKNVLVSKGFQLKYPPHPGISIGDNVYFGRKVVLDIPRLSVLEIGNRTAFTGYSYISAASKIKIGCDVLLGEFVSIRDAFHGIERNSIIAKQPMIAEDIVIEDDVWIGPNVAIL